MPRLQVNYDGLLHMPFADGRLVDANEPDLADVGAGKVVVQVDVVDVLHRRPAKAEVDSRVADGDDLPQVCHKTLQTVCRMPVARGEGNTLLQVTAADTAVDALNTQIDVNRLATDWNTAETTDGVPVSSDILTFTLRTARLIVPSLHIQNNSMIFVLCSGALHSTETESVIHKAEVHIDDLL